MAEFDRHRMTKQGLMDLLWSPQKTPTHRRAEKKLELEWLNEELKMEGLMFQTTEISAEYMNKDLTNNRAEWPDSTDLDPESKELESQEFDCP